MLGFFYVQRRINMALYTASQQSAIDAILNARRNDSSIAGGMTDAQKGITTQKPTTNSGTSVLRDAYDSRSTTNGGNAWNGYNPIGSANSAPSAYVSQAGKNTSGVGISTPASSYTGASSVIGNTNSFGSDMNKGYQSIYDSVRASDPTRNQINTWSDNKGNVYDTTKMTAQQIFAMGLSKDNNPNAAAILKGMGLDMNGNPTSPMPTFSFGGGGGGLSSDPRVSLSSVYADPKVAKTDTMTPTSGYTKNPTVDALPLQQQLDYYKQHPDEARQEVLRSMQVYNGASTDAQRNGAHSWADMIRQAAGISDSDAQYGNNNGIDSSTQRKYLEALLAGRNNVDTGAGTGADVTGGTGGTGTGTGAGVGTGTGTGQPSGVDLIKSWYESNLASQTQKQKSSRDLMLAGLAGKEGVINQNTIQNLNSNDVMANQRMQALKEAMANAGLSASGDNVSAQVGLGNSQQQGATDINNNKTNQLSDLLAQRNAINNNASADDLALLQQLQAQRDGLLLNQSNADRTFNYNAGQDAINNARQTKTDNWNAYMDSVGLTGNLGTGAKADWSLLGGTDGAMTLDAKTKYLQQEGIKVNNELAKIQLADYPAEQKLKMQQLQKQIAEIGKAPYQSAVDVEYDKIKLDTAKEQLNQLKNGPATKAAEESAKKMEKEKAGLASALKNGDLTYSSAEKSIREDLAIKYYTPDEAAQLTQMLKDWAANAYGNRW